MKWKQKRSVNISSDVNTNRILPCAGVRMLPVMFWIQPSVPSSTAPTSACVTKSTNSSSEPTEKFVFTADDEQQDARRRPRDQAPRPGREERIAGEERENRAELILEEQADQHAGDQRAENPDLLQHRSRR